jgi:dihydrolipoamide dehydrogenase
MLDEYDVAIVGGGGGGFMAAYRAGQLGGKVLLIEKEEKIGGVCTFWGCIPVCFLSHCARSHQDGQRSKKSRRQFWAAQDMCGRDPLSF